MPNREGDNRLDEENTKELGAYSSEFSEEDKIGEGSLLKNKLEKDLIKEKKEEAAAGGSRKILQKQLDNSIDDILKRSINLNIDLYRFSGMQCIKMNNISIFEFSTGVNVTKDNLFCVEIVNTDDNLKLGKWVMPPSTDMEDILSEFPLDKHTNLKSFLKCCKQHVNCYSDRQEQYNNLKNIISNLEKCSLDANLGLTRIHLHMSGIEVINDPEQIYNIILFMAYKSNEALPYLISIEKEDNTLSPKINKIFQKYFKPFKNVNLSAAFEQIIDDNRHFIWKKVSKVSNNFDEYITEEKDEEKKDEESSLENDLTELQMENGNSKYSSNSIEEDKAKSKSNKRGGKKINKQKKDFQTTSTSTIITKAKEKEQQISVGEKKQVEAALNGDIFTKNKKIDQSTKNFVSNKTTKTSLKENPDKYFSSTPKLNKRKTKLNDIRLSEISSISSLSTNMESKKDLTNILNENDDNSLSVNERQNDMQRRELLKTIREKKDVNKNNTGRKTNKRGNIKKQQNKKGN
ncbi:PREDICTED: uncharacterized protein LOC107072551 [Polistes dominula]|uniref:Uncharacterized protein LOC107072551 n=1 Tax=Polistes dominula TaxID=743375 RepID=A0ABM1J6I1_POLDO|nr:PREDICTED: uncharacterized protein LOC107072551 [Polistes dominula]